MSRWSWTPTTPTRRSGATSARFGSGFRLKTCRNGILLHEGPVLIVMGTRSQKRTVGASLWIIFKATKTRFGMRKSALQAGHLTSSLPSSNFSKRFASGVIVIWVWQPLHGTSIEPAQRSAPVKLISFLSSGIATPICYPSPDRSGTIPAQQRANARLVVGPKHTLDWQKKTNRTQPFAAQNSKFPAAGS